MLAKTHAAFGIFSGLIIQNFVATGNKTIFFLLVLLGALLPDIDSADSTISTSIPIIPSLLRIFVKHRGIFHSLLFAFFLPGLLYVFISPVYGTALFIGYISHIAIDSITSEGINFLHPFAKLRLSGFIDTGGVGELVIFFLLLAGIVINFI